MKLPSVGNKMLGANVDGEGRFIGGLGGVVASPRLAGDDDIVEDEEFGDELEEEFEEDEEYEDEDLEEEELDEFEDEEEYEEDDDFDDDEDDFEDAEEEEEDEEY